MTPSGTRPLFTIGHSTRSVEEIAALMQTVGADTIVDVRTIPRSRTNPQFNKDALPDSLAEWQIAYRHIAELGGLRGRQTSEESANTYWRNKSFRNYADYALTKTFSEGLQELILLAQNRTCAIMCAEILWWRCHRRIIADYLISKEMSVQHILSLTDIKPATLTPGATLVTGGILYVDTPRSGTPGTLAMPG